MPGMNKYRGTRKLTGAGKGAKMKGKGMPMASKQKGGGASMKSKGSH